MLTCNFKMRVQAVGEGFCARALGRLNESLRQTG